MADIEIPETFLHPGEWKLVRSSTVLKTVLGSCVGITFRVPRLGIAAMCHPMLPHHSARSLPHQNPLTAGRYVDFIIPELGRKFENLGAQRREIEVKLFGGADVLTTSKRGETVGKMNSDTAVNLIQEGGFCLLASHLGGDRGVFIEFHTGTGEVLLRRLNQMGSGRAVRDLTGAPEK
jgi:chemotaxis protein CheD